MEYGATNWTYLGVSGAQLVLYTTMRYIILICVRDLEGRKKGFEKGLESYQTCIAIIPDRYSNVDY